MTGSGPRLASAMAEHHVTRNPVEPRQRVGGHSVESAPRHEKHLGCHLVGDICANTTGGIRMHATVRLLLDLPEPRFAAMVGCGHAR